MPFDAKTSSALTPCLAYVLSDQGAEVAYQVVLANGGHEGAVHGGGLSGAARLGHEALIARMVLVEIGNLSLDMACECVAEICRSGAAVVVIGERSDMATYRALRRAGAVEYFSFPITADDILALPGTVTEPPAAAPVAAPVAMATSIAVIGSNGGVGASLLAQNLAFHAAHPKGANQRTALLDADFLYGSHALDLDRDETPGLFEALLAPARVDDTYLNATMDHLGPQLALYSNQTSMGQDLAALQAGLAPLMPRLRSAFDILVTDLPRSLLSQARDLPQHLDAVVVVIPAGFAGVAAASRLFKQLDRDYPGLRLVPVLSEVRRDAGLSVKDVQTAIGRPLVATLPRCDAQILRAHRAARPMIESQPRSAYATVVRSLWATLQTKPDTSATRKGGSFLKRMFG